MPQTFKHSDLDNTIFTCDICKNSIIGVKNIKMFRNLSSWPSRDIVICSDCFKVFENTAHRIRQGEVK